MKRVATWIERICIWDCQCDRKWLNPQLHNTVPVLAFFISDDSVLFIFSFKCNKSPLDSKGYSHIS